MNDFPGNATTNNIAFGCTGLIATGTSGWLYLKVGMKVSFFFLFLSSAIGGFLILVWGYNSDSDMVFSALVLLSAFGVASTFNIVYSSHAATFPTLFSGTAMGICNFAARVATIFAPTVA